MRACVVVFCLLLVGCMPVRYLTQAAAGQDEIARKQLDIEWILRGGHLTRKTRALLAEVSVIKSFGEAHGLRATSNYTTYVDLRRPEVIWVTTACEPLRFSPKTYSFPIIGSISYLGWFHREDADAFAGSLRAQGWDTDVRGSRAYSTLGWFPDPVLSTMLEDGPEARGELADTILHESLHATFYVPGQSTLNESVASFVGDTLAVEYMRTRVGEGAEETRAYLAQEEEGARRAEQFRVAYEALAQLYASEKSRDDKLGEKARIIAALREATGIRRAVTNATLIQYKTYGSGRRSLLAMLARCDGSFPKLIAALLALRPKLEAGEPQGDPEELLAPHVAAVCTPGAKT